MIVKHILVIDDSLPTRNLVCRILGDAGYYVESATDGNDGLMKLNMSTHCFHLVITDLNMPNTDGMGLLQMARYSARHKFTPILVMSTDFRQDKKAKCIENGASDFILKPFRPNELLAKVWSLC